MFEHFQHGENDEAFSLAQTEVEEVVGIVDELTGFEEAGDMDELTKADAARLVHGVALMSFRAGRSYQASVTDEKYVTVHIPAAKAGRFIEMLLEDNDA